MSDLTKAQVMVLVFSAVAVTVLSISYVWFFNPGLVFQAQATVDGATSGDSVTGMFYAKNYTSESTIYLTDRDVETFNSRYKQRTHEVGYCAYIDSEERIQVWEVDTIEASETHLWFTDDNCPSHASWTTEIFIHTHPSGNDELSQQDINLIEETDYEMNCIQYGIISQFRDQLFSFSCFTLEDGEPLEIPVEIASEE